MSKYLGFLMAMSASAFSLQGSIALGKDAYDFRVASYNVENFWDADSNNTPKVWDDFIKNHLDFGEFKVTLQYHDYAAEGSNWYSPEILSAKAHNFLTTLKLAEYPDIVALQEIESAGNLSKVLDIKVDAKTDLNQALQKLGYQFFYLGPQEEDNPVSVTTAFISKIALKPLDSVLIQDPKYSISARDIQVVELVEDDAHMVIFNGHWKSKIGGGEPVRNLTAKLIRQRIEEEKLKDPNVEVIVLGDLNTAYTEKPMEVLGSTGEESKMRQEEASKLLYNMWYELPKDERWESSFRGRHGTLSGMLISQDFYKASGFVYEDQSFQVVGHKGPASEILLDDDGVPYRWETQKKGGKTIHLGRGFSDHLPLVAKFRYIPTP